MSKISLEQTSSRPDLQIVARVPGAYIIKNNSLVPDLKDEAMAKREEDRLKKEQPKPQDVKGQTEENVKD